MVALPEPEALPFVLVVGVFAAASVVVWMAGTKLARVTDAIARRTGLQQAFAGMVLLGLTTSLPEVSTVTTAGLQGHPQLAATNLLGGIAMQVAFLAVADALMRDRALTAAPNRARVILQGVLCMLLLAVACLALVTGELFLVGRAGVWTLLLGALFVGAAAIIQRSETPWRPDSSDERDGDDAPVGARDAKSSLTRLVLVFGGVATATVLGGILVTLTAENIGSRTGMGASYGGAVLIAFVTSLPELSTVTGAIRLGSPTLAVSNIFGTNTGNLGLLLVADLAYDGAIINEAGAFSLGLTALGLVLTGVYLAGLLERKDRRLGRFGIDSVVVVLVYVAGLALLYPLR